MIAPALRARRAARSASALLLAASVALLAACSPASGEQSPAEPPEPARPVPAAVGDPFALAIAPLRGTYVEPGSLERPSLAAKIDNHELARPPIAFNQTDVVFEELVEGGLTRYVAVWHSTLPVEIGPVRSIRPMDPDIVTPLGGVMAYSGGQDQFLAMMMAAPLVSIVFDYDTSGLFFRADDRPGPHDVVLLAQEAVARNADLAPPPVQFAYGSADPLAGGETEPTSAIALVFSDGRQPGWTWDGTQSAWLRSQEGEPDLEASGEQIRATNIVTLRVAIDWSYGEVPRTVMVGGGEAVVSVNGRTARGTWAKDAPGSPIVLTAADGAPLRLAPGNTWVELVPDDGGVEILP